MKYVCVSKVNDIMQIFRFIENIFISEEVNTWFSLYHQLWKKALAGQLVSIGWSKICIFQSTFTILYHVFLRIYINDNKA